MQRAVAAMGAVLFIAFGTLFLSSCSRNPGVQASASPDAPTVAVAAVKTQDLSRALVLTAEFKPYQEVDVMANMKFRMAWSIQPMTCSPGRDESGFQCNIGSLHPRTV